MSRTTVAYQSLRQSWLQLARGNAWLEVNADCQEFMPDAACADYERHPKAIAAQRGAASCVIFDADFPTTIWQTLPPPMLDDRPMTPSTHGLIIESEIGAQRLLNHFNRRYPRNGAAALEAGFGASVLCRKIERRLAQRNRTG